MNSRPLANGMLACLFSLIGISVAAMPMVSRAALADNGDEANPYSLIMEKNIFHLQPPPPPPEAEKPKVDLPSVKLTGFVNIGLSRKVLFVSETKDKKEGPIYYSLSEGERSGDGKLELVRIHPSQEAVDVLNEGVAVTLTVKDDSLASTGVSPASAQTQPMHPGGRMPGRLMNRPGNVNGGPPGFPGGFSFPARARRNLSGPPSP